MAFDYPAFGQFRVSNELCKQGIFNSPGGIRSVWQRYDLESYRRHGYLIIYLLFMPKLRQYIVNNRLKLIN